MRTRWPAALLLLALSACHDEDEISVVNAGGQAVLVDLEWDHGDGWGEGRRHRLVEVPAGGIFHDEVGRVRDLEILIYRKSDGAILFAEDYDGDDFDDDHGHVEITVTP